MRPWWCQTMQWLVAFSDGSGKGWCVVQWFYPTSTTQRPRFSCNFTHGLRMVLGPLFCIAMYDQYISFSFLFFQYILYLLFALMLQWFEVMWGDITCKEVNVDTSQSDQVSNIFTQAFDPQTCSNIHHQYCLLANDPMAKVKSVSMPLDLKKDGTWQRRWFGNLSLCLIRLWVVTILDFSQRLAWSFGSLQVTAINSIL